MNIGVSGANDGASKVAATGGGSKGLRVGLWVAQVALALLFGLSGATKLALPYEKLFTQGVWVAHVPEKLVRFIGVAELLGALGLILPAATRIKPFLTPLAAAGFVVIMVLASALHVSIGERPIAQVLICGAAAFVVWGRFRKASIAPRA